jgi:beta-galactosidase
MSNSVPHVAARQGKPPVMRELRDDLAMRAPRAALSLNADWRFRREEATDGHWEQVNLPHSVRLEPLNASGGRNFQGVCWYEKDLQVDPAWRDRVVYLHFEGAMQVAEVRLNGRQIGMHHCGYTPFTIDLTPWLDFENTNAKHTLTVRLDNRDDPQVPPGKPQAQLDFTYFGGLYRNVRLEVMDRLHITDPILENRTGGGGIFVRYPHVSSDRATVRVCTDVRNEHHDARQCTVRQLLQDPRGNPVASATTHATIAVDSVATVEQSLDVPHPQLWHPYHPHLYTLRTLVCDEARDGAIVDEQITRIGIRHLCFDLDEGLFINGEKFFSLGCNRHQEHPYVGYALPDSAHFRDVKKLRDGGFTSVRCHYPQAPAFMDACDQLGMLVIVSNPGWQFVGDRVFQERAVQNARVMVRRDRNRPSVILWEAALNESDNRGIGTALHHAVHEEFPGDQCFTAGDHDGASNWDVQYLHNDGTKPYWIREWGDHVDNWSDQQSRNRVARGWGEGPMLVQAAAHLARLNEILVGHHGTSSGERAKRLCGACLWAAIDCQRGYHHQPFYGGVLDLFRLPKFDYYLFQSQRPIKDGGPMVFIANFATFLSPHVVTVFSNCEQVRLLRDGKEIAVQKPDDGHRISHPPFTFHVGALSHEKTTMYMNNASCPDDDDTPPVELRAEGLIAGNVVATHIVRPPGVATKIELEADLCGRNLVADGSDWVRVYAKVCDSHGTVCPFADDLIHFKTDGEGRIIGDGDPNIGANPMHAEAGIATALVRSTSRAGKIAISAAAFGLATGGLTIVSRPPATALRRARAQAAATLA